MKTCQQVSVYTCICVTQEHVGNLPDMIICHKFNALKKIEMRLAVVVNVTCIYINNDSTYSFISSS